MIYELWDSASGNAIAGFPTEDEALAVVRAEIEAAGRDAVAEWFLRKANGTGRSKLLAEGAALADSALSAAGPSISPITK